jgi:hypothetical protein
MTNKAVPLLTMEMLEGGEVLLLLILNLSTRWGSTPSTHWVGSWVGIIGNLDTEARRKIL